MSINCSIAYAASSTWRAGLVCALRSGEIFFCPRHFEMINSVVEDWFEDGSPVDLCLVCEPVWNKVIRHLDQRLLPSEERLRADQCLLLTDAKAKNG